MPNKGVLTVGYKRDEGYYSTRHAEIIERVWGPLGLENPASGEVVGDIPNYYQGAPDIFIGEVLG
jgi:hypothetical protein